MMMIGSVSTTPTIATCVGNTIAYEQQQRRRTRDPVAGRPCDHRHVDLLERIPHPAAPSFGRDTAAARSRATRSAARTSAISSAFPVPAFSTSSTISAIAGPGDALGEERLDRDLVGRAEHRRRGAAGPSRVVGEVEARNVVAVGRLERERAERRPVDRAERLGQPVAARRARGRSAAACRASTAARSVAPSTNSTMPCTIDCGCTTTSMASKSTPNNSCASITSRPLFIKRRRVDRDLGAHRSRSGARAHRPVARRRARRRCGRGTVRRSR